MEALKDYLEAGLRALENDHDRVHSIVVWPWIIDSLQK
jgi:hypothetical protein